MKIFHFVVWRKNSIPDNFLSVNDLSLKFSRWFVNLRLLQETRKIKLGALLEDLFQIKCQNSSERNWTFFKKVLKVNTFFSNKWVENGQTGIRIRFISVRGVFLESYFPLSFGERKRLKIVLNIVNKIPSIKVNQW